MNQEKIDKMTVSEIIRKCAYIRPKSSDDGDKVAIEAKSAILSTVLEALPKPKPIDYENGFGDDMAYGFNHCLSETQANLKSLFGDSNNQD